MWLLLWIVLSAILIGATLWSLKILMRQKSAWEAYAKDKSFTFTRGTFMGPAEMSGVIGDYKLSFFTAERSSADVRAKRFVTVIEINLVDGLIDGGTVGTKEMLAFMQSLDRLRPYPIEGEGWGKEYFAFMKYHGSAKAYLTPERIDVFNQLLKTRNADVILVFNDKELVLRLETSDPMQEAEKIDKIVKRLLGLVDKVRVTPEQRKQYMALAEETPPSEIPAPAAAANAPEPPAAD
jgi:hypothetical protein